MKFSLSDKKIYQKLGFSLDQEGILTRYMREGEGWKLHLQNTKSFIIESYKDKGYKSIAVFGSGWLLDLPIDTIIQDFEEIYLFDIIHPLQITHKYKKYPQIHFIEMDITGGIAKKVYEIIHDKKKVTSITLSEIANFQFSYSKHFDFVVSLNILNQLDILLIDALERHINIAEKEKEEFRYIIQRNHISMLKKFSYCLISDWEKVSCENDTNQITTIPLVFVDEPVDAEPKEWIWEFDSQGMYDEESSKVSFRVKAFKN